MGHRESGSTSLAPGFRFHPTDEELVSYYLNRKVCSKPFRVDAIGEIDIYKVEPWDLPGLSRLKSRDLEWYFFSGLDRKYGNGSRTNRATSEGYWKTTGKDRPVHHRSKLVGMKKTLVYHHGRAPHGKRTDWVMHEYRLVDDTVEKAGYTLDGVVLCRIFKKSGAGPKNGEKYGAPFIDEEWDIDNEGDMVPTDVYFEDPSVDDDTCIEQNDLTQDLNLQLPEGIPLPANVNRGDRNNYVDGSRDVTGNELPIARERENNGGLNISDDQNLLDLPVQAGNSGDILMNEHMAQVNDDDTTVVSPNRLSNRTSPDTVGDAPSEHGQFLDAIDFMDPCDEIPLGFDTSDPYLEDDIDIAQYMSFDFPPELMDSDADQAVSAMQNLDDESWQLPSTSQWLSEASDDVVASSSEAATDASTPMDSKQDTQYPFLGEASRLLGNITAPSAFASEFPSKDMGARLNSIKPSSSVRVMAGMIRISETTSMGNSSRLQLSFDKTGNVNVLLSFDLPQDGNQPTGLSAGLLTKMAASVFRGCTRLSYLWVFVFVLSLKFGSFIYAK